MSGVLNKIKWNNEIKLLENLDPLMNYSSFKLEQF